jgi:hypothetical protein
MKTWFAKVFFGNLSVAILPVIDAIGQRAGKECHSNRLQILALALPRDFSFGFCTHKKS